MNVSFNPSHGPFHTLKGLIQRATVCGSDNFSPTEPGCLRLAASWRVDGAPALLTCEWMLVGKADDTFITT